MRVHKFAKLVTVTIKLKEARKVITKWYVYCNFKRHLLVLHNLSFSAIGGVPVPILGGVPSPSWGVPILEGSQFQGGPNCGGVPVPARGSPNSGGAQSQLEGVSQFWRVPIPGGVPVLARGPNSGGFPVPVGGCPNSGGVPARGVLIPGGCPSHVTYPSMQF